MAFYPDNAGRADRLKQLVNNMDCMRTDIEEDAKEMDEKYKGMRPKVAALLKEKGIDNIEQLIEKAAAKMTAEERAQFWALIAVAKASNFGLDLIGSVLMAPEGTNLTVEEIMAVLESSTFMSAQTSAFISVASTYGMATEAVAAAAGGPFSGILSGIAEAVRGGAQKEALIKAIHKAQAARLSMAYHQREVRNRLQHFDLISDFLDASVGKDADAHVAAYLCKKLIETISAEDAKIDRNALEERLELQDKLSRDYYEDDDLSKEEVIKNAFSTENQ